jgi:hypothetical protein
MWDSHFRVGGAIGTELQVAQCPKTVPSIATGCMAASMMMHVTANASGYFENVWAWVADHDLDVSNPILIFKLVVSRKSGLGRCIWAFIETASPIHTFKRRDYAQPSKSTLTYSLGRYKHHGHS